MLKKTAHITVLKPDVFALGIRLLVYIAHIMLLKPDVFALGIRLLVYIAHIMLLKPDVFALGKDYLFTLWNCKAVCAKVVQINMHKLTGLLSVDDLIGVVI